MVLNKLGGLTTDNGLVQAGCMLLHTNLALFKQESVQSLHHSLPLGVSEIELMKVTLFYASDHDE